MTDPKKLTFLALFTLILGVLPAQDGQAESDCALQNAFQAVDEDVRVFHAHVSFLAHPFLGGRLPGTRGMEIAREYMEEYFQGAGLLPAFGGETLGKGATSYRQPFKIGSRRTITGQSLTIGDLKLLAGVDYAGLPYGGSGEVTGDLVFAGYGIKSGRGDYEGFEEGDSLDGKIALVFSGEPLDAEGKSLWGRGGRPSRYGRITRKLRDLDELDVAGVLVVVPPGAPGGDRLLRSTSTRGSRGARDFPVLSITQAVAEQLLKGSEAEGTSLMQLRERADQGRAVVPMGIKATAGLELAEQEMLAENVGGILPGKGKLANKIVVVGGHIDHLGMGKFGSRDGRYRGTRVHPGADDNATGAAALIMMAEAIVKEYAALPEGSDARTIIFIGFDAEEQGLLGARHYIENPIAPREDHSLMINFDMIGRLTEGKISVQGLGSAKGLKELLKPIIDAAPLQVMDQAIIPASDHWPFYSAGVPVLFSICHSLRGHPDYHTSRDTADRINAVDGVKAVKLYDAFLKAIALHDGDLTFQKIPRGRR